MFLPHPPLIFPLIPVLQPCLPYLSSQSKLCSFPPQAVCTCCSYMQFIPINPPSFSEFTLTHSLAKAWHVQGSFSQNPCSDQVLLLCAFIESFFLHYIISMISTRQTFLVHFYIHVWQNIPSSPLHIQKDGVVNLALHSLKYSLTTQTYTFYFLVTT